MATEIEMKLSFTDAQSGPCLDALAEVLAGEALNVAFKESRLENAYFDTPDFKLNAHKIALRIRRKASEQAQVQYIQTLKTAGRSENGLSQRGEWEWTLNQPSLDLMQLKACEAWPEKLNGDSLVKIFETNFTRYTCLLTWGKSLIELVLDWGEIVSNNTTEPLHEIELELKQGETKDLLALAEKLMQALPVRPLDLSKAERGFNLFRAH